VSGEPVPEKRPYLRGDRRRQQLLEATADLIAAHGLPSVTMVAVAEQAGVSRRLVYDHFSDLPSLFQAFFVDRVGSYLQTFDETFAAAGGDTRRTVETALQTLLDIPPADLRIIRMLTLDGGTPQIADAGDFVRRRVIDRWSGHLPTDLPPEVAGGVVWATFCGLLGLADLVGRGDLDRERAVGIGVHLATNAIDSVADAPSF